MSGTVYVVHCIDTEGPLYESLSATFERLRHIFHLDLEPSRELLGQLQRGEVDLGGIQRAVQNVVDPHLLAYNDTWDKVDAMLRGALSDEFRSEMLDSRGGGWVYNWFCLDHVNYDVNPRRRDIGYHNIFDHYREILRETNSSQDGVQFHYHPHPFKPHAHLCATRWLDSTGKLEQVLCRRIIDRHWFPAANRPGFQVNRPDSHWFLEQYIPFDLSNMAVEISAEDEQQFDFSGGRSGDWRRAPRNWAPYHPAHDDYQTAGDCRRWIARCPNVGTRSYLLSENDVRQAFAEARQGQPVVMAFTDHDFRDLRKDVDEVRGMLGRVRRDYPDVEFVFSEAVEAMRCALGLPRQPACDLELELRRISDGAHQLVVRTETASFGPQPYLAIKTVTGQYFNDNFDVQRPGHEWTYAFDEETFRIHAVEAIGVATNNAFGATTVATLDPQTGASSRTVWNEPSACTETAAA